jgi:N-acetylglucosamine kinase-like BadF-type ATPase
MNRARRVLGVDGGQSGIRLTSSASDRIVEVPGVSHLEGDTVALAAAAIAEAWGIGGYGAVDLAVLGLTTVPASSTASDRLCSLVAQLTGASEIWLMDDTVTGHIGALSGRDGVSLIVGTGVACFAMAHDRSAVWAVDGKGFLLGDDGGGFWIGRRGIAAVLRQADGRGPETALTQAAQHRFGDLAELHVRLHSTERSVNAIAQFARDVLDAAEASDAVASTIIDAAAEELAITVRAACARVANSDAPIPLAYGGRLLDPQRILARRVRTLVESGEFPVNARSADSGGLHGAIRLGLGGNVADYKDFIHAWKSGRS